MRISILQIKMWLLIQFDVNDLNGDVLLLKNEKLASKVAKQDSTAACAPILWKLKIAETNLNSINFKFKDENAKPVPDGIDYMDLRSYQYEFGS